MFSFKGMFGPIFQDLIAKGFQIVGAVVAGSGVATADQTTAIYGGLTALFGVLVNIYTNNKARANSAVNATAINTAKTTAAVIAQKVPLAAADAKK